MNVSNRGKNLSKNNNNNNQNNRINGGNVKNQKNSGNGNLSNKNKVQKINNLQAAASVSGSNKSGSNQHLENYLMNVKDPSIRRWLSKNYNINNSSCNETKMQQLTDKHQKKPPTPARKRSSLARPVRVHDSFSQENGPTVLNWNENKNLSNQQIQQQAHQIRQIRTEDKIKKKHKEKDERKKKNMDQAIDDLVEIRVDEEVTTWPIRLRLGEFFELSLPKCRRRKRRRRHRMMIATMREKTMKSMMEAGGIRASRQNGAFKDTERLLKVLSINNVDQDNRYNVTRCSVM